MRQHSACGNALKDIVFNAILKTKTNQRYAKINSFGVFWPPETLACYETNVHFTFFCASCVGYKLWPAVNKYKSAGNHADGPF